MTKKEAKLKYCDPNRNYYVSCQDCPIDGNECPICCTGYGDTWKAIAKHFTSQEPTVEMVNHPNHYNREGAMECIDEMTLLFGKEAVKHFCQCNAWKYRYRASDKNGEEDLKKSDWYMRKYKELCEMGDLNG